MSGGQLQPLRFKIYRVTEFGDCLFSDYEQAVLRLAAAEGREATEEAYSVLMHRKKEIYEYIEKLEHALNLKRTVSRRFT